MNVWNPIGSRLAAVLWILIWKILDVISTSQLAPLASTHELSPFINYIAPTVGFNNALFITVGIAVGIAYLFYYKIPVVVEVMAVYLPVAVIGNFSVYIHPFINNVIVISGIISLVFYIAYYEITHRFYDHSPTGTRFLPTSSQ